jgi:hypothetical protein
LITDDVIEQITSACEDGLDPVDGLTAEEALARVLVLVRRNGEPSRLWYGEDRRLSELDPHGDLVGSRAVPALLAWSYEEDRQMRHEMRKILEEAGLVAPWA